MKPAEMYRVLSPEKRKLALLLIVLAVVFLFLWMPSPSVLRRFLAPLWGLYPSAAPAAPGKRSPWDDRLNTPPPAVLRQRTVPAPPRAVFSNAPPPVLPYVPSVPRPACRRQASC